MKNLKIMIYSLLLFGATLFFGSCSDDDASPAIEIQLVTSEGNTITMEGNWFSGCVNMNGNSLQEVFTFDEQEATIDIEFFSGAGCQGTAVQEQTIKLDITHIGETYAVSLDGREVIANKIRGTETKVGEPGSDSFKQAFYIDDSGAMPKLYHGIFGDDGGTLTSDGYPLELHNIAITKQ